MLSEKMATITSRNRRVAGLISFIVLMSNLFASDKTFGATAKSITKNNANDDVHATISTVKQNSKERRHLSSSYHNSCGVGFQDASTTCKYPCPSGSIDECPPGMLCYFNTQCDFKELLDQWKPTPYPTPKPQPQPVKQPTSSPLSSEDIAKLSYFCGKNWSDASNTCTTWCPNGSDDVCPFGQSCFGDTSCIKTNEPTERPTDPLPTKSPSMRPTGPTAAPTVGLMVDQPSNHQFCGL